MAIIFSLYENLEERNGIYMAKTVLTGFSLVTIMYVMISTACIVIFGHELIKTANLMQNINLMYQMDQRTKIFVVSSSLRLIFTTILFSHVPFNFFMAKDALLLVVDEIKRGTTTKSMGVHDMAGNEDINNND